MSIESAEAFLQEMKKDKALQEKIYLGDSEDESIPGDPHFRSEKKFFLIVTAAGFDFTKEEWIMVATRNSNLHLEKNPCPHEVAAMLIYNERVWAGDALPYLPDPGSVCPLCGQDFESIIGETVCPECSSVGSKEDLSGEDPSTSPGSQKPAMVQTNPGTAECPRCGGMYQDDDILSCPFCNEAVKNDGVLLERRRIHDFQRDPDNLILRLRENSNKKFGRISLNASLLGVVGPLLVVSISKIFVEEGLKSYYSEASFVLSVGLFFGFESIAFVCGLSGRSSPKGKVGLLISSLLLGGTAISVLYVIWSLAQEV